MLTVRSFRTGTIFILNIPKENNSVKMVELRFLISAYCPMKLYICSKFHENIDDRFKVIEYNFETYNFKGAFNAKTKKQKKKKKKKKNVEGVTVYILYTLSDAALYLYQVS